MTSPENRAYDAYTREERRDREFAFRTDAFILATCAASLIVFGASVRVLDPVHRWRDVVVLAAAAAVSNLPRRLALAGRGLSLSGAIMLAAIPLGAGLGMPIIASASALARLRAQRLQQVVFNAAAGSLSSLLAALAYVALGAPVAVHGGAIGVSVLSEVALGLLVAIIVQAVSAGALLAGVLWASRGVSLRSTLMELLRESGLAYLATVGLAYLIVVTWGPAGAGPASVVLLTPTFVASRFAVSQWGNEWTARVLAVRAFTTALDERHPGAAVHAADVARVSEWIADELTMNPSDAQALNMAGALHGIDRLAARETPSRRSAASALAEMDFLAPALPILHRFRDRADRDDPPPRPARVLAVADAYARARARVEPGTPDARRSAFVAMTTDASGRFDAAVIAALGRVLERVDPMAHVPPPTSETTPNRGRTIG